MAVLSQQAVISQIDAVLERAKNIISQSIYRDGDCSDLADDLVTEINSAIDSTIDRLAPIGSRYRENVKDLLKNSRIDNATIIKAMVGILRGLKAEYASGSLLSIQELIHGDVFSDFLEMAEHLNSEGYKDPAAVLAGGVLEEHLRKLCIKTSIGITKPDSSPKKAEAMNTDLAIATVITKSDQKNVTAWLGLRNDAAHGHYDKYSKEQVSLLISSVRDFLTRNPA